MLENLPRRASSRAALTPVRVRLALGCALLTSLATISQAAEHANAAPIPAGAQLASARGKVIGAITGRTISFDAEANMVGAYGVLSASGYFADVLPSGALGQVLSLVYPSTDCSGTPAIEQSSVVGGPLPVPGYVFAFGEPPQGFNVPAGATLRQLSIGSAQQRTRAGFRCVTAQNHTMVYPLQINRAQASGFASQYAAPLRVQPVAALERDGHISAAPRAHATVPNETGPGADVPPDTPECAPGCYTPYLGDHVCESECANSLCGFDAGDCSATYMERAKKHEASLCAPACDASSVGDGFCDSACNVSSCEFDSGDCRKP